MGFDLVLVHGAANINSDVDRYYMLVVSRLADDGVYFHYISPQSLGASIEFDILVSPYSQPRSVVDTYII